MTDSKMLLTTNSSPYHCSHFPTDGSNPMPADILLHSRLPVCLLHALIQVPKSPLSCLNQLPVFPFFLLQLALIHSHSNEINMTRYTRHLVASLPPLGFTVSNSAAEYVTFAYKLLTLTEDPYSLHQSAWIRWNWPADLRICVVSW